MNIPSSANGGKKDRGNKKLEGVVKKSNNRIFSVLQNKNTGKYLGLGGAIFAGILLYKGFEEKDVTIYIDGLAWNRNISIESVQRLSKTDWGENIDGSEYIRNEFYAFQENKRYAKTTGRNYNHNPEYCTTIKVATVSFTYNSTTDSLEPVIGSNNEESCQYVDFQINDWVFDRTLSTFGDKQNFSTPYWPEFNPEGEGYILGNERESGRSERYIVRVSYNNEENKDTFEIPQNIWEVLNVTVRCSAEASFILGLDRTSIDWEKCY